MPFVSQAQRRACWARKRANPRSTWNCEEWESHTPKHLPAYKKKAGTANPEVSSTRSMPRRQSSVNDIKQQLARARYFWPRRAGADGDVPTDNVPMAEEAQPDIAPASDSLAYPSEDVAMAAEAARRSSLAVEESPYSSPQQPPAYQPYYPGAPMPPIAEVDVAPIAAVSVQPIGATVVAGPVGVAVGTPVITTCGDPTIEVVDASASTAVAWFFIILFVLILIALVVWWVITVICPQKKCDLNVRDINARDACASHNVAVGCNLTVGGTSRTAREIVEALTLPPLRNDTLAVQLDGFRTTTILTSTSTTAVTVTLPLASDFPGLVVLVLNESGATTFNVDPASTDTIDGVTGTVISQQSALFISAGISPASGLGDWKQLV